MSKVQEDDFFDEILNDAESHEVDPEQGKKLSALIIRLEQMKQEKAALEEAVKQKSKEIAQLEGVEIPAKFAEMGCSGWKLDSGEWVELQDDIHASIPEKYKPQAFEWLEKEGHGDLIKTKIVCAMERGQLEKAQELISILKEQGVSNITLDKGVHWGTLTSFTKEQLAQGVAIPLEILGVYIGKKVVVKKKK